MERQPIGRAAVIVSSIMVILSALITLGYLNYSEQEMEAVEQILIVLVPAIFAGVPAFLTWWKSYHHTTPLSDPRDDQGRRLVPEVSGD